MAQFDVAARAGLLEALGRAVEGLSAALAAAGEAYGQLDNHHGQALEEGLFKPLQRAYGKAQRAAAEYAQRNGLTAPRPRSAPAPLPSTGARALIERAVAAQAEAEEALVAAQDSPLYAQISDLPLRQALGEVRQALAAARQAGAALAKTVGR